MNEHASQSWNYWDWRYHPGHTYQAGHLMLRPKPELDPDRFRQPQGDFVDQVDLPAGVGTRPNDTICPHCLQPYSQDHRSWMTCGSKCGCCRTHDHQGKYCRQRWVSWNFYTEKLRRPPVLDENVQIRPTADEVKRLVAAGHTWATTIGAVESAKGLNLKLKRRGEDESNPDNSEPAAKKHIGNAALITHLESRKKLLQQKPKAIVGELQDTKTEWKDAKQNLEKEITQLHERLETAEEKVNQITAVVDTIQNKLLQIVQITGILIEDTKSKAEAAETKVQEAERSARETQALMDKVAKRIKDMGLSDRVWNHLVKDQEITGE